MCVEKEYEEKVILMRLVLQSRNNFSPVQLCVGCSWDFVPYRRDLALRLCLSNGSEVMKHLHVEVAFVPQGFQL